MRPFLKPFIVLSVALLGVVSLSGQTLPQEDQAPTGVSVDTVSKPTAPGKISLELKNVDIIDVLKLLSRKGSINMVTGPNVKGRVTLFLENVAVWDALRTIFETNDLAYIKEDNIVKVITGKEFEQLYGRKFEDKRTLRVIPIAHADANDVANTIKQTRNIPAAITVDERTNSLLVLEIPGQMNAIEETIRQLDVPITPKAFTLKYTSTKTVEEVIKKLLSKKGNIETDAITNKVIVTDFPDNGKKIGQVIAQIDIKPYLQTKVYELRYAKYDDVEAKLKELVTKDIGMIKADQRTNKVIVTDFPEKLRKIDQIVAAYDEKSREVLIEAKIIEVTLSDDYRFGLDWESIFNNLFESRNALNLNLGSAFEQITQQASTDTLFFRRANATPGVRIFGSGKLAGSAQTFNAVLDALKKVGDTKILSNPRVTAISGQEAIFKVVTRQAFVTDTVVQNPAAATTAENVTFVDVGVNLKITPIINPDHYITLKIKPEISSVASTLTTARGNTIPIVSSQELETIVMVKDGVTLILGGLIQDKAVITTNRVPVLGNLPLIGNIFRKDVHDIDKTELVFFLTPTVVTGETDFLSSSRRLLKTVEEKEKLMWKDTNDIDYPDKLKSVKRGIYPSDGPQYPDNESAKVSPLRPRPPGPNGQFRLPNPAPEGQTDAATPPSSGLTRLFKDVLGIEEK